MLTLDYSMTLAHAFVECDVTFTVADKKILLGGYSAYAIKTLADWVEFSNGRLVYLPDAGLVSVDQYEGKSYARFKDAEMKKIATAPIAIRDGVVYYVYEFTDMPILRALSQLVIPRKEEHHDEHTIC